MHLKIRVLKNWNSSRTALIWTKHYTENIRLFNGYNWLWQCHFFQNIFPMNPPIYVRKWSKK
jgi:hypothetical protein